MKKNLPTERAHNRETVTGIVGSEETPPQRLRSWMSVSIAEARSGTAGTLSITNNEECR
jgi:hypothetical protein